MGGGGGGEIIKKNGKWEIEHWTVEGETVKNANGPKKEMRGSDGGRILDAPLVSPIFPPIPLNFFSLSPPPQM